jgi:hypothetical protein
MTRGYDKTTESFPEISFTEELKLMKALLGISTFAPKKLMTKLLTLLTIAAFLYVPAYAQKADRETLWYQNTPYTQQAYIRPGERLWRICYSKTTVIFLPWIMVFANSLAINFNAYDRVEFSKADLKVEIRLRPIYVPG